jgi:hypothetical protein
LCLGMLDICHLNLRHGGAISVSRGMVLVSEVYVVFGVWEREVIVK